MGTVVTPNETQDIIHPHLLKKGFNIPPLHDKNKESWVTIFSYASPKSKSRHSKVTCQQLCRIVCIHFQCNPSFLMSA